MLRNDHNDAQILLDKLIQGLKDKCGFGGITGNLIDNGSMKIVLDDNAFFNINGKNIREQANAIAVDTLKLTGVIPEKIQNKHFSYVSSTVFTLNIEQAQKTLDILDQSNAQEQKQAICIG